MRSSILSWRGFGRSWGGGPFGVPERVSVAWRDCDNDDSCDGIFRTKDGRVLGSLELD